MSTISTILAPVDFSSVTPFVANYVKNLAATHGASVVLLHVTRPMQRFAALDISTETIDGFATAVHEAAIEKMQQLKESTFAGMHVEARVEMGYPPEVIVNVATEINADLLVMSTHGYSGLKQIVFGSVAEKVVKTSPVPVLTLRPDAMQHD